MVGWELGEYPRGYFPSLICVLETSANEADIGMRGIQYQSNNKFRAKAGTPENMSQVINA
jgi:hypothetical protein